MLRVTPLYGASLPAARPSPSSNNAPDDDDDDPPEWLSAPVPACTLVEYAGMRLLLNAGWDESLPAAAGDKTNTGNNNLGAPSSNPAAPIELSDADAVLLCDSTLASLGALPRYFGASDSSRHGRAPRSLTTGQSKRRKRRNPPFLATHPTAKMGQMALYDRHAALSLDGRDPGYSLEDVDAVFGRESVRTLKYSQTVYLPLEEEDE